MRAFLAFSLLVPCMVTLPAAADDIDCTDWEGGTQLVMNTCSGLEYEDADKALNRAWQTARKTFPGGTAVGDLQLEAQRAWLKYRDGHCQAEGELHAGGSIRPLIENTCKEHLTRQRTEELTSFAQQP